jgi:hypothetical protein
VSFAFDPHQGLVIVHAEIWEPSGSAESGSVTFIEICHHEYTYVTE